MLILFGTASVRGRLAPRRRWRLPGAARSTSRSCSRTCADPPGSASGSSWQTSPALLNRFYIPATRTFIRHDAVIDKLIGEEAMAFFATGISGLQYRRRAVQAGMELLHAVGYGSAVGPWRKFWARPSMPGVAHVDNVGEAVVDFTALADTINVAAWMQQGAAGGLFVAGGVADELMAQVPERTPLLRGHEQPMQTFVLTA